jgi:hypothetical protein
MNQELFFGILIGSMFLSSITLGQFMAGGQDKPTMNQATTYAQTARQLLNQTIVEFSRGNSTGAEELATEAYLDNSEYVEAALEEEGAANLKEQLEDMMHEELRDMVRNSASIEEIGSHINVTNVKLVEAISILNRTSK